MHTLSFIILQMKYNVTLQPGASLRIFSVMGKFKEAVWIQSKKIDYWYVFIAQFLPLAWLARTESIYSHHSLEHTTFPLI